MWSLKEKWYCYSLGLKLRGRLYDTYSYCEGGVGGMGEKQLGLKKGYSSRVKTRLSLMLQGTAGTKVLLRDQEVSLSLVSSEGWLM